MQIQRIAALALLCVALGCKPNLEAQVPGTWTGSGNSITFKADKTFSNQASILKEEGTWAIDNGDLVATPTTVNGQPVAKVKELAAGAAGQNKQVADFINDLDKQNIMTLSADGKTMTTDKSRDKNSGPSVTLTKQGS